MEVFIEFHVIFMKTTQTGGGGVNYFDLNSILFFYSRKNDVMYWQAQPESDEMTQLNLRVVSVNIQLCVLFCSLHVFVFNSRTSDQR